MQHLKYGEVNLAITSIKELWVRKANQDWKAQVKATRTFLIYVDSNLDHTQTILASGSLPGRLAVHPYNPFLLAELREVVNDTADPLRYTMTVNYNSKFEFDPATANENPLLRPAIYDFSFERTSKAVRYDILDGAIENSARTPIDPPLELEISIPIIKITINKAVLTYSSVADVQDCVNLSTWLGFAAGLVKIRGIEIKQKWENNYLYFEYNWTLAVKWDGWNPLRVLDQGFHTLDSEGEPVLARDKFQTPYAHPVMLDGEGNKLTSGSDPVYLDFQMYREVEFVGLIP